MATAMMWIPRFDLWNDPFNIVWWIPRDEYGRDGVILSDLGKDLLSLIKPNDRYIWFLFVREYFCADYSGSVNTSKFSPKSCIICHKLSRLPVAEVQKPALGCWLTDVTFDFLIQSRSSRLSCSSIVSIIFRSWYVCLFFGRYCRLMGFR